MHVFSEYIIMFSLQQYIMNLFGYLKEHIKYHVLSAGKVLQERDLPLFYIVMNRLRLNLFLHARLRNH